MEQTREIYKIVATEFRSIEEHLKEKKPELAWEFEAFAKHWERLYRAKDEGKLVAWFNFGIPPEVFVAMDIVPQQMENILAPLAAWPEGKLLDSIDFSHQYVPDYLCFAHKTMLGAVIDKRLPKPDIVVGSTHPCDSSREGHDMLAGYFDLPHFVIDIPYWNTEAATQYVAGQIKSLFRFLEERTGKKLDIDKLREVIRYSNKTQEYVLKTMELRKAIPCPLGGRECSLDAGMNTSLLGTPEALEYFKKRYEQAREKVDKKVGMVPDEKIRIAWLYLLPFFDTDIAPWLQRKFGAVVVADMMCARSYGSIDERDIKDIYRGLAIKTINLPMAAHYRGPAKYFVDEFAIKMCKDYKADVAFYVVGVACRSAWGLGKLVKDALRDVGIPMFSMEVDIGDPRICSPEEMRAKMENFFKTMLPK